MMRVCLLGGGGQTRVWRLGGVHDEGLPTGRGGADEGLATRGGA